MTSEPRTFPIADVLSVTTGVLLSHDHIEGVYRILNFLTGDSLLTHQLPGAAEACRPQVIAQHPWLADIQPPAGLNMADLFSWLTAVESEHPEVALVPVATWERRDPIKEACDLVGANKVIVLPVLLSEGREA
ncbi:hypothetical protein Caci_2931 [Catenulispora acidiphila DSM 44928]|uniref:DUF7736 domain-containing protein n=1 Tax=Catenulispora acidiphila (strain DSM 44928 / JCM 14897 / NBRC 102108 / NRRL B-24433 / ID139908) TaxID=479433 RepID=C7Q2U8_CATAD|nr:hypothetical protein [Catenulispora acidiphila]ACU71840.1 hypothetical protein Caci_2931 [Catenulispora acidiphila DSM 44928]